VATGGLLSGRDCVNDMGSMCNDAQVYFPPFSSVFYFPENLILDDHVNNNEPVFLYFPPFFCCFFLHLMSLKMSLECHSQKNASYYSLALNFCSHQAIHHPHASYAGASADAGQLAAAALNSPGKIVEVCHCACNHSVFGIPIRKIHSVSNSNTNSNGVSISLSVSISISITTSVQIFDFSFNFNVDQLRFPIFISDFRSIQVNFQFLIAILILI
jgi:hypothetical protein